MVGYERKSCDPTCPGGDKVEPIIYALPKIDKKIEPKESNFYFDEKPSPKLIKYGFNTLTDELDLSAITNIPQHKAGLNFDFERTDSGGIYPKVSSRFKIKKFDQNFAEIWEILLLFSLLNTKQTIATNHTNTLNEIVTLYGQISSSKPNISVSDLKTNSASLVIYKYSDINIDENAAIDIIMKNLKQLLSIQNTGAAMILQLFSLQTQTSAEIIYYLTSLYNNAYLVKPVISSDLLDSKYLVLIGLKEQTKFSLPSYPENVYLISMDIGNLENDFVTKIQCMNSQIIPLKYKKYIQIKNFLDTKVYEGSTYQEMIDIQDKNTNKWIETFFDKDAPRNILDESLKLTDDKCANHNKLMNLIA